MYVCMYVCTFFGVVFLGGTLGVSLHPGVQMGTGGDLIKFVRGVGVGIT